MSSSSSIFSTANFSSSDSNQLVAFTSGYVVTKKRIEATKMTKHTRASYYFSVIVKNAIMLS